MGFTVTQGLKWSIKIILLLVFIVITNHGFIPRLHFLIERDNYSTVVIFILFWALSLITLFVASYQQQWFIRLFWAILIGSVTAVSYGFYVAAGSEPEVLDVLELWQARHETGRAFEFYQHALVKAALIALLGFVIIVLPPPVLRGRTRKYLSLLMWIPFIPIFLFSILIFIKSDKAIAGLPQQYVPLSIASAIAYKMSTSKLPVRHEVKEVPPHLAKVKHIVYLVDESINPDYLYTSNDVLLKGLEDNKEKIANFGVAVSASNCSARSNAILRLGGTRHNLIQSIRKSPSIWQYAKKAGFRTIYIDAQDSSNTVAKPNDYQNYMTNEEAKYIDVFHKIKNVEAPQLDFILLDKIKKELNSPAPSFVYANKNGAHFPYNNNYPATEAIYRPVVTANQKGLAGLMGLYEQSGMAGVINTYKNSLHWNVDVFFRKFFEQIDLQNAVVIYTSDHGQHFEQSSTTHCSSGEDASITEGLVPLMLITENRSLKQRFSDAARKKYNLSNQFSIFPTILELFGYSDDIQQRYGADLMNENIDEVAAFNTGDILGILSNETVWVDVTKQQREILMPNVPKSSLHGD